MGLHRSRTNWLLLASAAFLALVTALAVLWLARGEGPQSIQPDVLAAAPNAVEPAPLREVELNNRELQARRGPLTTLDPALDSSNTPAPVDDLGSTVWGFVLDANKAPVAEAYLALTDTLGERITARGGSDGSYWFAGLAPGRWYAEVSADGLRQSDATIEIEPGASRVRQDFQLQRIETLIVRVLTPDGRPFHDAAKERQGGSGFWLIAVATQEHPGLGLLFHRGTWQQRFGAARHTNDYPSSPPGAIAKLELLESLPLYVSVLLSQEVLSTQRVELGQGEVTFVFDVDALAQHLGSIDLTVVYAESGAPIAGAKAAFFQAAGIGQLKSTDAAGKIQLQKRAPGQYDFHLSAQGRESARFWIDVPPGGTVERTIALGPTVGISGRVVDELGQPLSAPIEIAPLPPPGEPSGLADRAFTVRGPVSRSDGSFDVKDLGRGQWLIQCQDRQDQGSDRRVTHMSANVVVDTRGGPVSDLVVRVEPAGTVVVNWLGADRASLGLRFLDPNGMVRRSARFWSSAPQRVSLPQGPWTVRVLNEAGNRVVEREFILGADPVVLELGR